jgi:hypothetical protein
MQTGVEEGVNAPAEEVIRITQPQQLDTPLAVERIGQKHRELANPELQRQAFLSEANTL